MKKGQVYEGTVTKVSFPNKCEVVVEGEDKKVEIKNALPGQRVSFRLSKMRHGKGEGNLLEVLEPAACELAKDEIACPHFGACGGCTYQNLSYEEQLKLKETQIRALLEPVLAQDGKDFSIFEGIKHSPHQFGYRNKMEFSFGDTCKGGELALGMHKRGSFYDIVVVDECQIVDADFRKILKTTLEYFRSRNATYFHRNTHEGYLRHLLVRKAAKTGEILVDLVTTTQVQDDELLDGFTRALTELSYDGTLTGVLHTKNDSVADAVKDEGTQILYGQDYFYEELLGLRFKITPFSFFQTNSLGAEVLYELARSYVGELDQQDGATVYDLYSGTGTIAQMLAPVAKKVIGVEIVEEAVEAAKENAARNGLTNCEFLAGDVLKVLDGIEEKPDFIVLDPPRDGIHPKALEKIIRYNVQRMVYISCKPTSLARDLEVLQARGYEVQRIACVDMFPGTVHVETVCLLSQRKPDTTIEVDLDISELEVSSAETKATYEEIKSYVLKKYGLKVSNLYIAQVKRECGIVERINYNLPKTEGNRVPQCPEDKRKAIKDAFIHFQMI